MIPYIGYGDFKLYSDFSTILNQLENKIISIVYLGYKNEIIRIDTTDFLMLFFSTENNKLFKITVNVGAECLLNDVSVIGLHEKTLFVELNVISKIYNILEYIKFFIKNTDHIKRVVGVLLWSR